MIIKNLKIQILTGNSLKMFVIVGFDISSTLGQKWWTPTWHLCSLKKDSPQDDNNSDLKKDSPQDDNNSDTENKQYYAKLLNSSRNSNIRITKDEIIPEEILTIDAAHQDESEDDIINDVEMKLMDSEDEDFVSTTISKEGSSASPEEENLSKRSQIIIVVLVFLGFIPLFGIVIYLVGLFHNVPDTLHL